MQRKVGTAIVELVLGNIVEQDLDAIVNAANTALAGGGGVDGAIHRAAGPRLQAACLALPADAEGVRCPTGEVRVTDGFDLKAKVVVHAVGPFWNEARAEQAMAQLRRVHEAALDAAVARGCRSIAFPAISTGAYRFPMAKAAKAALAATIGWLRAHPDALDTVRFVLFKPQDREVWKAALEGLVPLERRPTAEPD